MNERLKHIWDMQLTKGEITKKEYQEKIMLLSNKTLENAATIVDEIYTIYENTLTDTTHVQTHVVDYGQSKENKVEEHLLKIQEQINLLHKRFDRIEKIYQIDKGQNKTSSQKKIGCYSVLKKLGEGGYSKVYLAIDSKTDEHVAIKLLKIKDLSKKINRNQLLDEFIREVDVMMKMEHSSIAKIKGAGNYENSPYIVMEYIEGKTVSSLVQNRKLNMRRSLIIAEVVAKVLEYGYNHYQLIHRDIKPANIIHCPKEETFKLLDFGLAKCLGDAHHELSRSLTLKGTPFYMSPEQVNDSSKVDFLADIYSLGCTMYYMLSGIPPYKNYEGYSQILDAISQGKVIPLKKVNKDIPDFVISIVEKAMAHKKEHRFQNYDDLRKTLRQAIGYC